MKTVKYEASFNNAVAALRASDNPQEVAYVYYAEPIGLYGYFLAGNPPAESMAIRTRVWLSKSGEVRIREYLTKEGKYAR